ncbi:PTS sugar transporter subunit IIB [Aerococcaceae bacterium DSM 111020]|nr:PTS sugar transporter subunit IIB [Aerococcaceae bacterium DSM 111020]
MKILVACGNGSGTSLMLKKSVEKAMNDLDVKITQIHQTNISEGKNTAKNFDAVFTPMNFVKEFERSKAHGTKVFGIKNVMSAPEVKKAVEESDLIK